MTGHDSIGRTMDATRERYRRAYWEHQLDLIAEMMAPYQRSHGVILDLGCGIARNARRFAAGMDRYIGLNIDREELAIARANHPEPQFEFHQGDAMDMRPIADQSVDVILLLYVLEHIADPARLWREIARVLRPGGGVLFVAPNLINATSLVIKFLPDEARLRLKQLLTGKQEPPDYPIYYRCNTVAQMDRMAAQVGMVRDRLEMASSLGYLFAYPGFFAWHRLMDRATAIGGFRRFREIIFATYRKTA
jgi:SAM-dependent methyltransferase